LIETPLNPTIPHITTKVERSKNMNEQLMENADSHDNINNPKQKKKFSKVPNKTEVENDPSAKIGSKLLLGWTMLASVCDSDVCQGSVPLMRDSFGKVLFYIYLQSHVQQS
jgi:hypothetical protein